MPNNIYLKKFFNWVNGRLSAWCLLNYSPVISHQFIFSVFFEKLLCSIFVQKKKIRHLDFEKCFKVHILINNLSVFYKENVFCYCIIIINDNYNL